MNTLLLIAKLLPAIIDMIKAVEVAIPVTGAGAAKLDLVIQLLQLGEGGISADLAAKIITLVVTVFNKFGIFTK